MRNKGVWEIEKNEIFTPLRRKFHKGVKVFYVTLIALEEHRVKLVNIFMQERRLLCKMQINSLYNQSSHFIQTILITLKSLPVGKS
ncbi:hypothetical protein M5E86_04120 [Blautia wexlerae]|nr:hypothetical protein M5E86_04120 [Blautia wexlerae]